MHTPVPSHTHTPRTQNGVLRMTTLPAVTVTVDEEEFSDDFQCCVCLDLIYKPVVLACGHTSCFWCIYEAMDTFHESHCPVCRNSYYYFPGICWLLHSLLQKLYPKAYQRRESQVMKEESFRETFSAQTEKMSLQFQAMEHGKDFVVKEPLEPGNEDNICTTEIPTSLSDKITNNVALEGKIASASNHVDECDKQVAITDLLCAICKELLCRPVVLNCGHVFCEVCIVVSSNEPCRCSICNSMHPNGFPKVCLVLEGFLEEYFSNEYAARRLAIDKLKNYEQGSSSAARVPQKSVQCMDKHICDSGHKVHYGIGCDCCGMYPLIGDRYRCRDCLEHIGFDLCEGCYNGSSNPPGRFNQQHKPDHKFDVLEPDLIALSPEHHVDQAQDVPENQTDVSTVPESSLLPQQDAEVNVADPVPSNDILGDREGTEPTT